MSTYSILQLLIFYGFLSIAPIVNAQSKTPTITDSNTNTPVTGKSGQCQYTLTGEQFTVAAIRLTIDSPCRKNEIVNIDYESYHYSAKFNENGMANLPIFLVKPRAKATIQFEQGDPVSVQLTTTSLPQIDRVLLAWQGGTQLDLHTLAFGATVNSPDDIWRGSHCDETQTTFATNSFYCLYGIDDSAMNLQVYTRQRNTNNKRRGIIDFRVDYFDRGSIAKPPYCKDTRLGTQAFTTQRISKGRPGRVKKHRMLAVECGGALDESTRYFRGFIRHINIR